MAEPDERSAQVNELMENAEGYISDAEFRDDLDMRQLRYMQATCALLRATAIQNQMILEMLREQRDLEALAGG